jgi:hypothetical protein
MEEKPSAKKQKVAEPEEEAKEAPSVSALF